MTKTTFDDDKENDDDDDGKAHPRPEPNKAMRRQNHTEGGGGGGGGGYFSSFQSSRWVKDGRSKVSFSLMRRLLEWCVKMSTRSFERLCVVDVESGTTRDDDDESCSTAERRDETTMKGILLLLFSLALIMRVVVVVVVLRLVKSEAVVLCVSRHETHESLPLLTRSHDVSSFYALRFPVDEFRVHVHLMRYSNNNKGNSSIREEREIVLSVFDDDD